MKVAVVGATGLVGSMMLKVLAERNFPVTELIPVASDKSAGKEIEFKGKKYVVKNCADGVAAKASLALFSAGGTMSLEWAPKFAEAGTTVIDNSSAWRMHPDKKLIVPEVNADALTASDKIIANPNCSTIQMVVALNPLHKKYKIKRIVVSTYQSVSGTGKKAVDQLMNERKGVAVDKAYPHQIDLNVLPHIDVFLENGYTKEEMKMENEGRKIMSHPNFKASVTCVRVPVYRAHSIAVAAEFEKSVTPEAARAVLAKFPGVKVVDDPATLTYPTPLEVSGKDDCEVGRIRTDVAFENGLSFWVVGDQLLKGAALNAVQIAEKLIAVK
jgi:aspartate-semialdehyde dehydrogenase